MINKITVNLSTTEYPIYIGLNILETIGNLFSGEKVLIVSNPLVYNLYGSNIIDALSNCEIDTFLISDGETYKNISTACSIYEHLLNGNFDRHSIIIALGGGVVGDTAGFVASTYMRGIKYVHVPTTLLAQVDSSIGGKVAINHPMAKNIIGSFYQPYFVYSDIKTLETLSNEEFANGMAEVIKYALIGDKTLFEFLAQNDPNSIRHNQNLLHLVSTCAQIKANIVEKDEKEQNLRMLLNFGHTIGHALESASEYTIKHGNAVSIGMVVAIKLSVKIGLLKKECENEIINLFQKYKLPTYIKGFEPNEIYDLMKNDKKILNGKVRFILIKSIGKVTICDDVPTKLLLESLREVIVNEK